MLKRIIFSVVLISPINIQALRAEPITRVPRLAVNYSADTKTLAINVAGLAGKSNCVGTVYGASSSGALQRDAERGLRLVAFRDSAKSLNFNSSEVEPLVDESKGKIHFRVKVACPAGTFQSKVVSRSVQGTSSSAKANSRDFLVGVRQALLRSGFKVAQVFASTTFIQPLDFQQVQGDKRVFIVEQRGVIRSVITDDSGASTQDTFLDVTSLVKTGGERGLLGLALHPNFVRNGQFFVNYTRLADGATVIARFTAPKGGNAPLSSESILMIVEQPFANHNGGGLAFGPDGFLYIGLGDGGSGGDPLKNGQNKAALLGKMLRIDVNHAAPYSIPKSNPFAGNKEGFKEEIFAYGLRNPFRFSFDRRLGTFFAGDVGQNTVEEIDIIKRGANYGWNTAEGTRCFLDPNCDQSALTLPIHEYGRSIGRSVTGGYVYRGRLAPNYEGVYIFADFVSGRIFSLEKVFERWVSSELSDTSHLISSFGQDSKGEIYFLSYGQGTVFKIVE